ncbi:hypothetical protein Tco_0754039 [Tanacetum coccineum]
MSRGVMWALSGAMISGIFGGWGADGLGGGRGWVVSGVVGGKLGLGWGGLLKVAGRVVCVLVGLIWGTVGSAGGRWGGGGIVVGWGSFCNTRVPSLARGGDVEWIAAGTHTASPRVHDTVGREGDGARKGGVEVKRGGGGLSSFCV